jgi:hypothetical protein
MPEVKDGNERVIMEITGVLVDMLVELNPELYGPYVVYERNRRNKILYVQVMRAIYGMLEAAILWYKKFWGELKQKRIQVQSLCFMCCEPYGKRIAAYASFPCGRFEIQPQRLKSQRPI